MNEESQPDTRLPSVGFQCQKCKFPQLWLQNPEGIELVEETAGSPSSTLKELTGTHLFRFSPSELQHYGSSLKGTRSILGETEVPGIKVNIGLCPFSKPPQSWQASTISETTSTLLKLFDLLWRSPETPLHPTCRPTKAAFPYECLIFAHASLLPNTLK